MSGKASASNWVREIIQQQASYHVPPAGDYIKLDAMENPWPMPGELNQLWRESLTDLQLNRYPDPLAGVLVDRLRSTMDIPADAAVMLGNGSDELIQAILMALAGENRCVLSPTPSFVMYEVLAIACGIEYVGVPLHSDFALDMEAMHEAIKRHNPAVIFLASPNNPTGRRFRQSEIEEILRLAPGLVVVDEAYQPFMKKPDDSFMSRLPEYPDLIVMRTLSKVGLAGIRLGLISGHPDWIRELDKLRLPYNINVLTQASASFALAHRGVLDAQTAQIRKQRQKLFDTLSGTEAIKVYPSEANFLLLRVAEGQAGRIFDGLKQKGILIKNLDPAGGMLADCLRVTVGRPEENTAFVTALGELV